jgi:hypothetical protein
MGIQELIGPRREEILRLAARYGVERVRVFGSFARGDAGAESDLDLLVAFRDGRSLFDLIGFGQDVGDLLGREVDVVSERGVSPYLQDRIFAEVVPL